MDRVLITGGTGMIGRHLATVLHADGYEIGILSRTGDQSGSQRSWEWDIQHEIVDEDAINFADHIVHLAGANLADKKWSGTRKKEILESRIKPAELLYKKLSVSGKTPKSFISASGIAFYGWNTGSILVDETRIKPGDDFLAVVVREWESSVHPIRSLGIRTVILRNGPVLSPEGGFLKKILPVFKAGFGAAMGGGDQYISWIHIEDLCRIISFALRNNSMEGVYNAVSPEPVTNEEMMHALATALNKPFFLPHVPSFALRLLFGEMSSAVLGGNKVSSAKIESKGFTFKYGNIKEALNDLLKNELKKKR